MKQTEIKPCCRCGKGVMHTGLPLLWQLTIQRMQIDVGAVRRQHGLEMMLGSPLLAFHMGPQENMVKPLLEAHTVWLCEACATEWVNIAAIDEAESEREAADKEDKDE